MAVKKTKTLRRMILKAQNLSVSTYIFSLSEDVDELLATPYSQALSTKCWWKQALVPLLESHCWEQQRSRLVKDYDESWEHETECQRFVCSLHGYESIGREEE